MPKLSAEAYAIVEGRHSDPFHYLGLHHEGNLYFDSMEGRIYFAPGVYSWNAEELVQIMKLYIGSSLQLGPEWREMLQEQEFDDA